MMFVKEVNIGEDSVEVVYDGKGYTCSSTRMLRQRLEEMHNSLETYSEEDATPENLKVTVTFLPGSMIGSLAAKHVAMVLDSIGFKSDLIAPEL